MATLDGTVTDSVTGQPISGASVTLSQGSVTRQGATDTSGHYSFGEVLANVDSSVEAAATNYVANPNSKAGVTVPAGGQASRDLNLTPLPGSLQGTVTDKVTHAPIAGASYRVSDARGNGVASGNADGSGHYAVASLPAGRYSVVFTATSYTGSDSSQATVVPNTAAIADGQLVPLNGRIRGTVADTLTGKLIPDATVTLTQGSIVRTTTSDGEGRYAFEDVLAEQPSTVAATANHYLTTARSSVQFTLPPGGEASHTLFLTPLPGSLTGTITDATTGLPIDGAMVQVYDPYGHLIATVSTDAAGHYAVPDLPEGLYTLVVSHNGYLGTTLTGQVVADTTTTADGTLSRLASSLSGIVRDVVTNRPIPGATVQLFDEPGLPLTATTADALGQFAFPNLPAGQYSVSASATNYTVIAASSAIVGVVAGNSTTQTLYLQPLDVGTILTGIVYDSVTNLPIPGATVQVFDTTGALAAQDVVGEDGRYTFTTLPVSEFTVTGWARGYLGTTTANAVLHPNATTTRDLPLLPIAASLIGNVLDEVSGLPIPNAAVELVGPVGPSKTIATNNAGTFGFAQVEPGTYTLHASSAGYVAGDAATTTVVVPAGGNASATMQLTPLNGSIFGTVTDQTTGAPIPGATVQLVDGNGTVLATIIAGADGTYDTGPLPARDDYTLRFYAQGYTPRTETGAVVAGQRTEVDAALVPSSGAISGMVVDVTTGQPVPASMVTLVGPTGQPIASTPADGNGGFAFLPPTPGPYVVQAEPPTSGAGAGGYVVIPTSSRPVLSVAGQETSVTLQLSRLPATLAGIVVDAVSGAPLPGATVTVAASTGEQRSLTAGDDGRFAVQGVAPGRYSLTATLEGYWPSTGATTAQPGQTAFVRLPMSNTRSTVGGDVFDPTGRSVPEANVTLWCPPPGAPGSTPVGSARTDAGGNFVISLVGALPTTGCALVAEHPDYYPMTPYPITAPTGDNSAGPFHLILAGRPATLRITTVDERTGKIISSVNLTVTRVVTNEDVAQRVSDQEGLAVIAGLIPDDYRITAEKPGYAPKVVTLYAAPNRTVEMRLRLSLALTGIVTDVQTGDIIPFARVTLYKLGSPTAPGNGRSRRALTGQTTGASTVSASPTTPTTAAASASTATSTVPVVATPATEANATNVVSTAGEQDDQDGVVLPIVSTASSSTVPARGQYLSKPLFGLGAPLADTASPSVGETVLQQVDGQTVVATVVGSVTADAQGRFWFDLIDEGDYRATAEAPGWFRIDESEDSGNVTIEGPLLVVPLRLTRAVPAAPVTPQLPRTGGGALANQIVD